MKLKYNLLLVMLLFLGNSCYAPKPSDITIPNNKNFRPQQSTHTEFNQPFTIAIGQTLQIDQENTFITFDAITEDSRCPEGVSCFWTGIVKAHFTIKKDTKTVENLELSGPPFGNTTSDLNMAQSSKNFNNYNFVLLNIYPYPQVDTTVDPKEYQAEIIIKPATEANYRILGDGKALIFDEKAELTLFPPAEITTTRFNPTEEQIMEAEGFLLQCLIDQYPNVYTKYRQYYRQYVGLYDQHNKPVIWMNAFIDYDGYLTQHWTKDIVQVMDGGDNFFNAYIFLEEERCQILVNGEA